MSKFKIGDEVWLAYLAEYEVLMWNVGSNIITSIKRDENKFIYYFDNQDFEGHLEATLYATKEEAKKVVLEDIMRYKKDLDDDFNRIINL